MTEKRAHVLISGRVQAVYYRDTTKTKALANGVTGWVRNLADGRVEALFEGEAGAVDKLVSWCWQGPAGATVDHVEVNHEPPTGEYLTFQVRR